MLSKVCLKEMADYWANRDDLNNYLLSPTNGDLKKVPELTIFVGTHEIFLPDIRDFNSKLKANKLKINYYKFIGQNHVFLLYPIPEVKLAFKKVVEQIG